MTRPTPLPTDLAESPFRTSSALERGVTYGRLRGRDLARPFHGVRVSNGPESRRDLIVAAATRLSPWQAIGGSSAAELLGLPLPPGLRRGDAPVVVVTEHGRSVPQGRGYRGVRLRAHRLASMMIDGVWATDSVTTWCMLSRELELHDLVAVGDILITDSKLTDRRCERVPLDAIAAACVEWRHTPGAKIRQAAADLLRLGVDSPQESRLRCLLIEGGLPEPTVHPCVRLPDGRELRPDLGYESLQFGFEYEGARHADPDRVLFDISRFEDFAAARWDVMRVTKFDLRPPTREFLARARRRLKQLSAG